MGKTVYDDYDFNKILKEMWGAKNNPQRYLARFDSLCGYKPRILNTRMEELLCCFLKVQIVSWLLGATGKAGIKNRKWGNLSKFKLLSTI